MDSVRAVLQYWIGCAEDGVLAISFSNAVSDGVLVAGVDAVADVVKDAIAVLYTIAVIDDVAVASLKRVTLRLFLSDNKPVIQPAAEPKRHHYA